MSWRMVPAFIGGVLATLAASLVVLCRGPARADSAVTGRIVRWWAAVWLRAAGARVVVRGLELVRPGTAYVVVSNHQSNLDPMVCLRCCCRGCGSWPSVRCSGSGCSAPRCARSG